jgi:hypothetical protein
MTALPAVKREALRFRIWQFAAPREWDVTVKEIAEALDEPWLRVRNVIHSSGWTNRLRGASDNDKSFGALARVTRAVEGLIVQDILAGRVNSEFTA